jgi:hypothetical protein
MIKSKSVHLQPRAKLVPNLRALHQAAKRSTVMRLRKISPLPQAKLARNPLVDNRLGLVPRHLWHLQTAVLQQQPKAKTHKMLGLSGQRRPNECCRPKPYTPKLWAVSIMVNRR